MANGKPLNRWPKNERREGSSRRTPHRAGKRRAEECPYPRDPLAVAGKTFTPYSEILRQNAFHRYGNVVTTRGLLRSAADFATACCPPTCAAKT
jgi:hypothetical protein